MSPLHITLAYVAGIILLVLIQKRTAHVGCMPFVLLTVAWEIAIGISLGTGS